MAIAQTTTDVWIFSQGDLTTRRLIPKRVVWNAVGSAADTLKIVNGDSSMVLAETLGTSDGTVEVVGLQGHDLRDGLKVTTMSTGKLFVYL
jgi:hypothetical protein